MKRRGRFPRSGRGGRLRGACLRLGRNEAGASAIEFSLVAPLFLAILFGIVVFSIYLATWLGVSQAAAEAARASVAGLSATERQSLALTRAQAVIAGYAPLLDPARIQLAYPAQPTGLFAVRVTYPLADLNLGRFSPIAITPTIAPTRMVTVTTGGY